MPRMLLKVSFDTRKANENFREGRVGEILGRVEDALQPEAVYFYPENGKRTGLYIFDLQDTAQLPSLTEPLFQEAEAEVFMAPVMNREDLQRGLQQLPG